MLREGTTEPEAKIGYHSALPEKEVIYLDMSNIIIMRICRCKPSAEVLNIITDFQGLHRRMEASAVGPQPRPACFKLHSSRCYYRIQRV